MNAIGISRLGQVHIPAQDVERYWILQGHAWSAFAVHDKRHGFLQLWRRPADAVAS